MHKELRNPQIINGEMQPRHHFIGLESVRQLYRLVEVFSEAGIDLLSIPMIQEVEDRMMAQDFEVGTVLGCIEPILPPHAESLSADFDRVLVWDGGGIAVMSIAMYLHKMDNNWRLPGEDGYEKPNLSPELELSSWLDQSDLQPAPLRGKQATSKRLRHKKNSNKTNGRYHGRQRSAS